MAKKSEYRILDTHSDILISMYATAKEGWLLTYAAISESVNKLVRKYGERNPFRLCHALGIMLLFRDMGDTPDSVKGFFLEHKRIRTITVNSGLPDVIQRIIVAHEICHAVNHRSSGVQAFHEVSMFVHTSDMEKDANLFAAELLLEDQDVLEVLNQDTTFFSAAAMLYVLPELLDFKFRVMKWKGYKLIEPPIRAYNNFLRDLEVPDNADRYT